MEVDTFKYLIEVEYNNIIPTQDDLNAALSDGPKSIVFTKLVAALSKELQQLCKLEGTVNAIENAEDSSNFVLELSSFLKELNCPHKILMEGPVSQRLFNPESRRILLHFLFAEVQAARMITIDKPEKTIKLEIKESSTALDMKQMLIALNIGKPPNNITAKQLFNAVLEKLKTILSNIQPGNLSKPLFTGVLTLKQWEALSKIQKQMHEQYKLRKEMLITRVNCTIQSFQWSDRLKNKIDQIIKIFDEKKKYLNVEPTVDLSDILCAREDLAIIEKTSSAQLRMTTKCEVNKVLIGAVPDRGGRPEEQQPPPPEMPSWQKQRSEGPPGGNRGQQGGMAGYDRGRNDHHGRKEMGDHGKGPQYMPSRGPVYATQPLAYQQPAYGQYDQGMPLYAQPGYSPYAPPPPTQFYQQYDNPRGRGGNRRGGGGRGGHNNYGQYY